MDPKEALKALLEVYRDQAPYLERADRYFRAEPNSVNLGSRVNPKLAKFRTPWPAVRIATNAYAERVRLEDVSYSEDDDPFAEYRDIFISTFGMAELEALATGIGYHRTVVLADGSLTFAASRGRDGAYLEDPDTGEILASMRVHRPRTFKGYMYSPQSVTVYTPGVVTTFKGTGGSWSGQSTRLDHDDILMLPVVNRPRAGEPYGRAEARDLYAYQDQGSRTMTGLSIATDALAVPQRVIIAAEAESLDDLTQIQSYTDAILALTGDARVDQWQAAQLLPFVEAMTSLARQASSTTGIPLSYWGIASEANAASGDSIRETDNRLNTRAAQIASQWTPVVARQAETVANLAGFDPGTISVRWVDPATHTPSMASDAALKMAQLPEINGQAVVDRDMIWDVLRVSPADRQRIREGQEIDAVNRLLSGVNSASSGSSEGENESVQSPQ